MKPRAKTETKCEHRDYRSSVTQANPFVVRKLCIYCDADLGPADQQRRIDRQSVERLFELVWDARARLLAHVAVFVVSDDAHNAALVKKAWAVYSAAQDKYHDTAKKL